MTRKKVDLTYVISDTKRKATSKKRKNGLLKKVDEISTLCGIEACAIVYAPNDSQPDTWPPSDWGVQRVLARFRRTPELEQGKRMMNQESFLRQRIIKAQEQLNKQRNDNRKREVIHLMLHYLSGGKMFDDASMLDMNDLSWLIDQNLKEIDRMLNRTQEVNPNDGGEQQKQEAAHVDHVQQEITNVDVMQKEHHWPLMGFFNGAVGDEMLPFGDVGVKNGIWPSPHAL
ncbi:hypothetical protein RJT34_13009 [Clitoria ternatea]|uniref:MADS-box domain-containing protein n=1 Tax=Clitoria ternatea TaxID=43366 RepID=A0AAN9JPW1_CLITE